MTGYGITFLQNYDNSIRFNNNIMTEINWGSER